MRVLISADMEGISGITAPEECAPDTPGWERNRKVMTAEINAAIAGAFDGGADAALVCDAHASMRNLLPDELDSRARLIRGRVKNYPMMEGVERADLVFMVGYHAPAGAIGVLSHTWLGAPISQVRLNGDPCSEGRMNAVLAGSFGVPVGLFTGDDRACEDASRYISSVTTVAVKNAIDRFAADCLPVSEAHSQIHAAAAEVVKLASQLGPTLVTPPFSWELDVAGISAAQRASWIPSVERRDSRTIGWTMDDYQASYRLFQAVATLINVAVDPVFG